MIRQHGPVSEQALKDMMINFPNWMIMDCLAVTRIAEEMEHEFTGAEAALRVYLETVKRA